MDDIFEAIQSYMTVVVLFCGFFKKFIKIFQLISTNYFSLFS